MVLALVKPLSTAESYRLMIEKVEGFKMLPVVAMRVNSVISSPTSSVQDLLNLIRMDQALSAKLLRLVNSPYYRVPGGVTDLGRALSFLGFNTIAQVVLGLSVVSLFEKELIEGFSYSEFWKHSLAVAVGAEFLARKWGDPKPEEAFTCGLLHDIGKLVLNEIDRPHLEEVVASAKANKTSFTAAEKNWDLPSHTVLGQKVAKRWGLPAKIQEVLLNHHLGEASVENGTAPTEFTKTLTAVRMANRLSHVFKLGNSGNFKNHSLDETLKNTESGDFTVQKEWMESYQEKIQESGALLNVYR